MITKHRLISDDNRNNNCINDIFGRQRVIDIR